MLLTLVLRVAWPVPAVAQDFGQVVSPILTVDRELLFRDSAFGKRISALLDAEAARREAETRRIESELVAEEMALTEKRGTMPAAEFRALADAFDEKVVALRAERNAAQQDLVRLVETAQLAFLEQVSPVLTDLVRDANATLLLDRRSAIWVAPTIDITQEAIARIDATFGDDAALDVLPDLGGQVAPGPAPDEIENPGNGD